MRVYHEGKGIKGSTFYDARAKGERFSEHAIDLLSQPLSV